MLEIGVFMIYVPALVIDLIAVIILFYWSRKLEQRRYVPFVWAFVSSWIGPLISSGNSDGHTVLLFPYGFTIAVLYLFTNQNQHALKWKAVVIGLLVGMIHQILQIIGGK